MSKCSPGASTPRAGSPYGTGSRPRPGANPVSSPRGAWGSSRSAAVDMRRCVGRANDLKR